MTHDLQDMEQRLKELRSAFDDAFASPPGQAQADWVELLLINVGDQTYAIGLSDLSGLEVNRKIISMPLETPGLLGLCAVQGQLVPVFDLAAILGTGSRKETPHWLVLHRDRELIGLAFDESLGARRVAAQEVHSLEPAAEQVHLTREAIQIDGRAIHVVDMAAVASNIRQAIHPR